MFDTRVAIIAKFTNKVFFAIISYKKCLQWNAIVLFCYLLLFNILVATHMDAILLLLLFCYYFNILVYSHMDAILLLFNILILMWMLFCYYL